MAEDGVGQRHQAHALVMRQEGLDDDPAGAMGSGLADALAVVRFPVGIVRSEEHTSELQSHHDLVCPRDLHCFPTRRSSDLSSAVACTRGSAWRRCTIRWPRTALASATRLMPW